MKIQYPDYGNCGVNVISSIMRYFGAQPHGKTLPALDKLLCAGHYRNVVLMLFDGMGMAALEKHLRSDGFLRARLAGELSAVFPPTTTAATTSIETGLTPAQHAWVGWTVYYPQIDKAVDVFINKIQDSSESAAEYRVGSRFEPLDSALDRISRAGQASASNISRFGDVEIDSLDGLFSSALSLCREEGKHYLYTYWGEPDHTMHEVGCGTEKIGGIVRDIESRIERFCAEAPEDTLVLVTADHGLLDTEPVYMEDMPRSRDMLLRKPTVEPRAAAFYVKDECKERFPEVFREEARGKGFDLIESAKAVADGLFGEGEKNPRLLDYLGDYLAIATDKYSLFWDRTAHRFVGMHAGLTEDEMRVPLITAEK